MLKLGCNGTALTSVCVRLHCYSNSSECPTNRPALSIGSKLTNCGPLWAQLTMTGTIILRATKSVLAASCARLASLVASWGVYRGDGDLDNFFELQLHLQGAVGPVAFIKNYMISRDSVS